MPVSPEVLRRLGRRMATFAPISAEALGRYKLRTALSVLGVVLGVAAVIAMMSVTSGARHDALQQVQSMGLDNIVLRSRPVASGHAAALEAGDAERLRTLLPLVDLASPLVQRYGAVYGGGRTQMFNVLGVGEEYASILRLSVARGRFLGALDVSRRRRHCVLGAEVARTLFGYEPAVGSSIRYEGDWYEVVGVLQDRAATDPKTIGPLASRDLNKAVLLPVSVLLRDPRSASRDPVDEVWIHLRDGERVEGVGAIAERTLARLHPQAPRAEVVVPRELLKQRYRTQRTFGVVVGSIAALSLLVGGIGIMNIMLASVVERTHEIGIRRAVGATRSDITLQFLLESLVMTLSGGLAGILLGLCSSWTITAYAGWTTRLSLVSVALAVAVSFAVGLGFGIYPATKAAGLAPIDALRHE